MKTVSTACLIVILSSVTSMAQIKLPSENVVKTYGNATVAKIIAVDTAYTFRCDVESWPDVIGTDIGIRINGIIEPAIVSENGKPNRFFQMQAKKFLTAYLAQSKTITLKNIKRGKDFSLIADVVTDSNSLAEILIENGFATTTKQKLNLSRFHIGKTQAPGYPLDKQKPEAQAPGYPLDKQKPEAQAPGRFSVTQKPKIKNTTTSHYTASKNSKIFHAPTCRFARSMSEKTALKFATKEEAINSGRRQCKICGK